MFLPISEFLHTCTYAGSSIWMFSISFLHSPRVFSLSLLSYLTHYPFRVKFCFIQRFPLSIPCDSATSSIALRSLYAKLCSYNYVFIYLSYYMCHVFLHDQTASSMKVETVSVFSFLYLKIPTQYLTDVRK